MFGHADVIGPPSDPEQSTRLAFVTMNQHDTGTVPGQPLVIGFAGLGTMGEAMALRLTAAGVRLVVWNRTRERCVPLQQRAQRSRPTWPPSSRAATR